MRDVASASISHEQTQIKPSLLFSNNGCCITKGSLFRLFGLPFNFPFSRFRFGQGAIIGHFIVLAILWITRDMGGAVGWGMLFRKS